MRFCGGESNLFFNDEHPGKVFLDFKTLNLFRWGNQRILGAR